MEEQVFLLKGPSRAKREDFKMRYPNSALTPGLDSALTGAEVKQ